MLQTAAVIGKEFAEPILWQVVRDGGARHAVPLQHEDLAAVLRRSSAEFLVSALYP